MANNRYCENCSKLVQHSKYCMEYRLKLLAERQTNKAVRCIECVMKRNEKVPGA